MASSNPYSFVHRLEYLLMRAFFAPIRVTPLWIATPLAAFVGRFGYYILPAYRNLALRNIRLALGDELSEKELRRTVRASFENLAMNVVEIIHFPAITRRERIARYVDTSGSAPALDAIAEGRGALVIAAHLGNWELFLAPLLERGLPFCGVAQALPNGYVDDYMTARRESCGQTIVKKRGALRDMLKHLKSGTTVGFIVDQNARRHGVLVNFFGHPCSTIPTVASLAMKLNVPVVSGACYRVGRRTKFRIVCFPPLELVDTGDRQADLLTNTQRINDRIEMLVRREPKQWTWVHDRWRIKDSWFQKGRLEETPAAGEIATGD